MSTETTVTSSVRSATSDLSQVQLPPSSILPLPSGRTVYVRLIWRDAQLDEAQLEANRIGLVILAERQSHYQGTHNVTEKLTKLSEEGKIKTDSSFQILQSTRPKDIINFSEILENRHRHLDPERNIEIWGDTYDATFLAICLWLYETYNLPSAESDKPETVEQVLEKVNELGIELAEVKGEDRERLEQFLAAYLNHLKGNQPLLKTQSKMSRIQEWFRRYCCCCCAPCCPSKFEPMGDRRYNRLSGGD